VLESKLSSQFIDIAKTTAEKISQNTDKKTISDIILAMMKNI